MPLCHWFFCCRAQPAVSCGDARRAARSTRSTASAGTHMLLSDKPCSTSARPDALVMSCLPPRPHAGRLCGQAPRGRPAGQQQVDPGRGPSGGVTGGTRRGPACGAARHQGGRCGRGRGRPGGGRAWRRPGAGRGLVWAVRAAWLTTGRPLAGGGGAVTWCKQSRVGARGSYPDRQMAGRSCADGRGPLAFCVNAGECRLVEVRRAPACSWPGGRGCRGLRGASMQLAAYC
jgi:hypothetical protein